MDGFELTLRLVAGTMLILANGFFVAIEFALTRVRQYPESEFDIPELSRAWEMTQDLEIYLTSCQVGISATSIAVGIIAEPALVSVFEPYFETTVAASVGAAGVVSFVVINLLHLTHGEQTPTYLGVERTKFVARYGSTPLYWFAKLLYPVIVLGDGVAKWTLRLFGVEMTGAWLETETERVESRAELRHRLGSLLDRGGLSEERKDEVVSALTTGERPLRDVMTDVSDVVFLSTTISAEENLSRIGNSPHTRLPLIGDEPSEFRGIVYVPAVIDRLDDLQAGEITFDDVAAPPMTITEETTISDAVDLFQEESQELALVVDGSETEVLGLISATDALEAVMGEIEDPLDVELGGRHDESVSSGGLTREEHGY
jgi:CBS domain containing-hemolysin-like protein